MATNTEHKSFSTMANRFRQIIKRTLILIGLSCFFVSSKACSCIPIAIKDEVSQSKFIVQGTVISIDTIKTVYKSFFEDSSSLSKFQHALPTLLVKIKIEKIYKGNVGHDATTYVLTSAIATRCGFPFEQHKSYLIYGGGSTQQKVDTKDAGNNISYSFNDLPYMETSFCTRTTSDINSEKKILERQLRLSKSK